MNTTDWPAVVRALVASGLTQPQIAQQCGCGQATLSDLVRGKTKEPRYSTGFALLRLAASRGIEAPQAGSAEAVEAAPG